MDTSDSLIYFDEDGKCDYCKNYYTNILPHWHTDNRGEKEINRQIERVKATNTSNTHDCLIGLSGGVDSSYVTYLAKEKFGLKPLLYHVDTGWNSQEAVNNIEKLIDGLELDLYTEVIDWPQMRDLQLAFFKAGVPHLDTPQDHLIFAGLYNFAVKNKVKYILTGANYSTECVREPLEWHYHASDLRQIRDIHRKFGEGNINKLPQAGIFKYKIYYRFFKGLKVIKPLNYVRYIKDDVIDDLSAKYGWQRYAHKHYESRFTRFYEAFWLPVKFGFDKRRAHFSSLILTSQMTRAEALSKISKPAYNEETLADDFEYIAKKLGISIDELNRYLSGPKRTYKDFKNSNRFIDLGVKTLRLFGVQRAIIR